MTVNRFTAIAATIAVISAVVGGIYVAGSPAGQRLLRIDERRVQHLRQLARNINSYWNRNKRLPPELASLTDGVSVRRIPTDPETKKQYEYRVLDERSYRLCADFLRESQGDSSDDFWSHAAGRQCFDFDVRHDN